MHLKPKLKCVGNKVAHATLAITKTTDGKIVWLETGNT